MKSAPTILITDTLFVGPKHEQLLVEAGYAIKRLPQSKATEAELCAAIPGAVGYILGGEEKVTSKVIDAAGSLKGIVFTGIDYKPYIPAWEYAEDHGVVIDSTPDGPSQAVAEWAMASALAMNRRLLELDKTGHTTPPGLWAQKIGIIGYGRVGKRIAELMLPFKPASVAYYSHHKAPQSSLPITPQYQSLHKLLAGSDVVFLCVSELNNIGFFGKNELAAMKPGALLVSISHQGVIDDNSLYDALSLGKLRAALDYTPDERFSALPVANCFCMNQKGAFNTTAEIDEVSTTAVHKMIALLGTHPNSA